MSNRKAPGPTGESDIGLKQQGRRPEGDLNLGASSTTGNEEDSGTLFVQDAQAIADGTQLGAASGVDSLGTAGAPPAQPGGGDGTMEMDWGPAGPGKGVSGTGGQPDAGPTHPSGGYTTTRTTGGFVQHPNDSGLSLPDSGGGVGNARHNQEIAASEDARDAVDTQPTHPAGSGNLGGGMEGGPGPRPIQHSEGVSEDAVRSAT